MKVILDAHPIVGTRSGVGEYTWQLLKEIGSLMGEKDEIIPFYFNFRRRFQEQETLRTCPQIKPFEVKWVPGFILHRYWRFFSWPSYDQVVGQGDLFHFPNFTLFPVGSSKKVVLTVHDLAFCRFPETLMEKNLRRIRALFEGAIERADAIITVSDFSKNEFHHFYPHYKKPVYPVHNGVSQEYLDYRPNLDLIEGIKRKYQLPEDYFLHVGTIEPRKNLSFLIPLFEKLSSFHPKVKMVLVGGKGWKYEEFFQQLENSSVKDQFVFPGFIDQEDLPHLYGGAKALIFPSLYEGFGLPPLESLACGTPVLASKIPIMEEVLADCGRLVSLEDRETWVKEMVSLIENDKEERKSLENCSWSNCAEETLKVYQKVLAS